ncbi:MAG: hypothetical protein L0H70_02245 [Xanthomonadales bacterium]|nr:hypothetical protein [Xanthomonadales bacterium]
MRAIASRQRQQIAGMARSLYVGKCVFGASANTAASFAPWIYGMPGHDTNKYYRQTEDMRRAQADGRARLTTDLAQTKLCENERLTLHEDTRRKANGKIASVLRQRRLTNQKLST